MGLLQNLTGWHAIIILAIILLIFGAAKLPALARSVGQSMRIMKTELRDTPITPAAETCTSAPPPQSASTQAGAREKAV